MTIHRLPQHERLKALGIGIVNAALLSAIMVPAFSMGANPMPEPPSMALAQLMFGENVPLPVGLLFHLVYVTFWSLAYVTLFRDRLTISTAAQLGLGLWIITLLVFFPLFGWGVLGLDIGPGLIPVSLAPHVLFVIFLWGLCRLVFRTPA